MDPIDLNDQKRADLDQLLRRLQHLARLRQMRDQARADGIELELSLPEVRHG